ncbi:DNA mismatch repair endonuclease MutL [Hymenobacter busanensis]|uniref:DNA mismatch repair protein MutL n=1 Tax=Hymenobacter busanensis TaxID=2607656 RepID=A0A7L4ZWI4_9BACT|nr:DNA mismatch repair endonuclease MutL [Hymenobacter busanensis]KAA9332300.1 DNA mismatch repair endonuclease MutL [Hymenobacter busanensis]QHJ07363.1 DNA mismatch repair endonuclease MutL [Hymenobacter busanensis]
MSDIIQLLPEYLANQIAAGEVVQRPASVVKELLENAVDAKATHIQLIVKEAGKQLVQVVDNGSGMSATDARMSLERHATSKIRTTDDLFRIRTLGFRGEALASIAAVAQVEIRTKLRQHDTGTLLLVEGSQVTSQQPTATADGTSIAVKNLFFNVPARRNFLKSNAVEMRHILDEFQHVALAHPDITFTLYQNDLEVFNLPAGKLSQRIVALLGQSYKEQLAQVEEVTPFITVKGYIGKPEAAKKSRGDQFFFVNGRFIRSAYLNHAVLAAYEGLLPRDTHPFYVLFLELDPKAIDINVHPTKTEIKFEDEKTVYAIMRAAVKQALGLHNMAPSLDFESDVNFGPLRGMRTGAPSAMADDDDDTARRRSFEPNTSLIGDLTTGRGAAAAPASRPPREPNWLDEKPLTPRPTEQARQALDDFYRSIGQTPLADIEAEAADLVGVAPEPVPTLPFLHPAIGSPAPEARPEAPAPGRRAVQVQQFVLVPVKSGLMLIDQAAARERILYEQYQDTLTNETGASQALLFPRTVTFTPQDFAVLREMTDELQSIGFRFAEFGPNTIAVEALPAEVPASADEKALLEGLLEQFRVGGSRAQLDRREQLARSLARRVAASVPARLAEVEMNALVDKLFACQVPGYTPDGRRTLVMLEADHLQEFFRKA